MDVPDTSNWTALDWDLASEGVPYTEFYRWDTPNYINPPMKGRYLIPLVAVLLGITWTIVPLRLYSRIKVLKSFAPDDWFIIPATLTATAISILSILSFTCGLGRHFYDVPLENYEEYDEIVWISSWMFTLSIALAKFSMLMFYRRFANTKLFKIGIWVMMGYTFAWMVTFIVVSMVACRPIQFNWTGDGTCWEGAAANAAYFSHAALNTFGDLIILIMPLPTVVRMKLPLKQKAGLLGIFLLGGLVTIASTVRIVVLYNTIYKLYWDVTWSNYESVAATNIEIHITLFCSSVPVLKPLFKKAINIVTNVSSSRKTNSNSDTGDNILLPNLGSKGAALEHVASEPKSFDEESRSIGGGAEVMSYHAS